MSMLAERKRKQKWSLNPRGKAWSEDGNKFGQKMLEKMGWQKGKGLGSKEDGMLEHVKVAYKNDSKGMGFKENDDQWIQHETNFAALLDSLTGGQVEENIEKIKLKSLEKKSQSLRARVHYKKFTKAKDLSSRSEKDLANIFGKKTLKNVVKQVEEETKEVVEKPAPYSSTTLINSGSMADYFKNKLPNFGKVLKKEESDSEGEFRTVGFGFNSSEEQVPQNGLKRKVQENISISNVFSPRKKVKNGDNGVVNPAFDPMNTKVLVEKHSLETILETSLENDDTVDQDQEGSKVFENSTGIEQETEESVVEGKIKKKKKKKKIKVAEQTENVFYNQNFSENIENDEEPEVNYYEVKVSLKKKKKMKNGVKNEGFKDYSDNSSELKEEVVKKKDKKKKNQVGVIYNQSFENCVGNGDEIKEKKVKKNKKGKNGIENPNFNDFDNSLNEDEGEEAESNYIGQKSRSTGVESKKQKKKKLQNGIENPNFNDFGFVNQSLDDEVQNCTVEESCTVTKKKKSKKTFDENLQVENVKKSKKKDESHKNETDIKESSISITTPIKIKGGIDNASFTIQDQLETPTTQPNPYEIKPKKSKRQSQEIDNPSFNMSDSIDSNQISSIIEDSDLMLNVVSTPIRPQTPKSQPKVVETSTVKKRKSVRFSDVTQERIIPNKEQLKEMENIHGGVDNVNFDKLGTELEENLAKISNTIDRYQAEIENDMNEKKAETLGEIMIGEVGNSDGENENLPHGAKLKFKYAKFNSRGTMYFASDTGPKKSYKHLIKGDIVVNFKNTNLHEIDGYAYKKKSF